MFSLLVRVQTITLHRELNKLNALLIPHGWNLRGFSHQLYKSWVSSQNSVLLQSLEILTYLTLKKIIQIVICSTSSTYFLDLISYY